MPFEFPSCSLGENPLTDLSDEEFGRALDSWRQTPTHHKIDANWCIRFLNEAERRWRPGDR